MQKFSKNLSLIPTAERFHLSFPQDESPGSEMLALPGASYKNRTLLA